MSSSDDDDRSVSSGGDQQVSKIEKSYKADEPVEDDKTAREKLKKAGFDPDDVHTARSDLAPRGKCGLIATKNIPPMTYFAALGDLPMCRYLHYVREATTTAAAEEHWTSPEDGVVFSPMLAALLEKQPKVAKWLFGNGARDDAFVYVDSNDLSPLSHCFRGISSAWPDGGAREELAQWFILNGALDIPGYPGKIDPFRVLACCAATVHSSVHGLKIGIDKFIVTVTQAKNALNASKPDLLSLSEDLLKQTDAFHTFLLGTLPSPNYSNKELTHLLMKKLGSEESASIVVEEVEANGKGQALWNQLQSDIGRPKSSNLCLSAHPGILERIGAYVGFVKSRTKLKRLRSFHEIASELTISNLPEHCFEYSLLG